MYNGYNDQSHHPCLHLSTLSITLPLVIPRSRLSDPGSFGKNSDPYSLKCSDPDPVKISRLKSLENCNINFPRLELLISQLREKTFTFRFCFQHKNHISSDPDPDYFSRFGSGSNSSGSSTLTLTQSIRRDSFNKFNDNY